METIFATDRALLHFATGERAFDSRGVPTLWLTGCGESHRMRSVTMNRSQVTCEKCRAAMGMEAAR